MYIHIRLSQIPSPVFEDVSIASHSLSFKSDKPKYYTISATFFVFYLSILLHNINKGFLHKIGSFKIPINS